MRFGRYLVVGALALTLVACNAAQAAPAREQDVSGATASQTEARTITVVGTGKVRLVPDMAQVSVGASAMAQTVSAAKSEVEGRMEAISEALTQMGVDEADIQTSHYSIHYEREPMKVPQDGLDADDQGGYRVWNELLVKVRDVERAGDVLDACVEAGANQVQGVSFTVSDESTWQGEARERAMADARSRAQELASLANVELGEVVSISEVIGGWSTGISGAERGIGGGMAPGELELSTRVQVMFAIEQ